MKRVIQLRKNVLKSLRKRRWLFKSDVYNELEYLVEQGIKQALGSSWTVKRNPANNKKAYYCDNCGYRSGVPAKRCIGCGILMIDGAGLIVVKRSDTQ